MIKLFVSDMDGTLLHHPDNPHSREMSLENKQAVLNLHASGIRFMMASGRDINYRHVLEKTFGFQIDAIGMNGCNVVIDHEILCDHGLSYEDCVRLTDALVHSPVTSNFLGITSEGDYVFEYIDREPYQHFYAMAKEGIFKSVSELTIEAWLQDPTRKPFNKLVGMVKTIEDRNELLHFFEERFGDQYDVIYSGRENIEIMPKNISKGQALLELMELKGYQPTEVAVIGDSMNDLTMLQAVPFSFAMSHSDPHILKAAKYVVDSVAEAIEKVLQWNQEEVKREG